MNVVVIGAQWGDEGKGKIVDFLAEHARIVVRFSGGANAGHTIVQNDETYKLHLIPSGILYPDTTVVLGTGMVIDPTALFEELATLTVQRVKWERRVLISDRAHVVLPGYRALDRETDEKRAKPLGTTGRGIGIAYSMKATRHGVRIGDITEPEVLESLAEEDRSFLEKVAGRLQEMTVDLVEFLCHASVDDHILFEGAQGTLLDVDFGTYPYTTSSNAAACGASSGVGVSPKQVHNVLGIMKAYTTRVGSGPFPTEVGGKLGDHIREKGGEFGSTTGRPRRCGWFDAVAMQHSVRINGADSAVITKLDVLDDQEIVKICTGYKSGKKVYNNFPADLDALDVCEPIYEEVPGWMEDTSKVRNKEDLPENAINYIQTIEGYLGLKVKMVSVGPDRLQVVRI